MPPAARRRPAYSDVLIAILIAAVLGSIALAITTATTWSLMLAMFGIGASVIVGRLAWTHRIPGQPWRIRRLGPLPEDPGMPKKPEIDGDPFR